MNFSWDIYRELNPDLIKAGLKTKSEFENHYIVNGRREKRAFHLYQKYPDFNPLQYKLNNIDLQKMNIPQLEHHWLFYGRKENRTYLPLTKLKDISREYIQPVKRVKKTTKEPRLEPVKEVKNVQTISDYVNATYEAVRDVIPPSNQCLVEHKKENIFQEPTELLEDPVIEKKEPIIKEIDLKV